MDRQQKTDEQLAAMAAHLATRRATILAEWRKAVDSDPELTSSTSLPRTQFNDHIPEQLDSFEKSLHRWPRQETAASESKRQVDAASHGLQRWQQGYHLREVTREWGHLNLCLVNELENYSLTHPDLEPEVMPTAWRALAKLCSQGVSESTSQYFHLQQTEAAGHVCDMEQTLSEVRELERRRTEMFRQAAHDLRGNVGVVRNVTTGLAQESMPEPMREEFLRLLQTSVKSLYSMLDEVMDLARLQAGTELRDVKSFDVAALLKDLFENLKPLANERGLFLKADGPESLQVQGDAVKIRRIAQNLLLNALKYTRAGGVTIGWGDAGRDDSNRWMLYIADTGPGYHAGPGSPMAEALKEATTESKQTDEDASKDKETLASSDSASSLASSKAASSPDFRPNHQERGEGIGLSIVKRLCELLDASVELESKSEVGTTFRVVLPRHYEGV